MYRKLLYLEVKPWLPISSPEINPLVFSGAKVWTYKWLNQQPERLLLDTIEWFAADVLSDHADSVLERLCMKHLEGLHTYIYLHYTYIPTYIPTYPPPCMHAMHNIYTVQCLWLNNNRMRCGRFDNQGCIKNHIHKISANYIFSDAEGYFSKQNQFLFGGRTCELHLKIEYTPKCHLSNESYDTPVIYSGYWGCPRFFLKQTHQTPRGFCFSPFSPRFVKRWRPQKDGWRWAWPKEMSLKSLWVSIRPPGRKACEALHRWSKF